MASHEKSSNSVACGGCTINCLSTHSSSYQWTSSFFKVMEGKFSSVLEIPAIEFVIRIECRACKDVILRGPSGHFWHINICCTNTSVSFTDGWESFVSDNGIAEKDILVFRHIIDTYFDVQVFGPTKCEKQGTSSLQNFTSCCLKEGILSKLCNQKSCEHRKILIKVSAALTILVVEPKKSEEIEFKILTAGKEDCRMAAAGSSKDWMMKPNNTISQNQVALFRKQPRISNAVTEFVPCSDTNSDSGAFGVLSSVELMGPSFSVILKKGAVSGFYRLAFPKQFERRWLPKEIVEIILVHHKIPGKWRVSLRKYAHYSLLMGGWRRFVVSNGLHKQDRCVFTLINTAPHTFKVDVTSDSLFR